MLPMANYRDACTQPNKYSLPTRQTYHPSRGSRNRGRRWRCRGSTRPTPSRRRDRDRRTGRRMRTRGCRPSATRRRCCTRRRSRRRGGRRRGAPGRGQGDPLPCRWGRARLTPPQGTRAELLSELGESELGEEVLSLVRGGGGVVLGAGGVARHQAAKLRRTDVEVARVRFKSRRGKGSGDNGAQ